MFFNWRAFLVCGLAGLACAAKEPEKVLQSTSLNTCQQNSGFSASQFHVTFTPNNRSVSILLLGSSSITGNVQFDVAISAYGYEIERLSINPCDVGFKGLCPMASGNIGDPTIPLGFKVSPEAVKMIPDIAYTFPDLDAKVRIYVNATSGDQKGQSVACVEARISNGQTVDLVGVKWASAIVAFLALFSSAVLSGFGYTNAASHVAANAVSLFGYFQAQAMVGLCGMPLPPIVQSWTQDFQWSMGLIRLTFMQRIYTWYQRSTGGVASTLFHALGQVSVQVQKRALPAAKPLSGLMTRATAMMPRSDVAVSHVSPLSKRANIQTSSGNYLVYGIQRAGYRAKIESTNIFMTAIIWFIVFMVLSAAAVAAWKGICEIAFKKSEKFSDFRNGWRVVLKGVLFRVTLIGYPLVAVFCLWELTQNDSPAEMVLAVVFFLLVTGSLLWATYTVMRIARRSVSLFKNPAYTLFSDLGTLNKWGFLYIQFRASAYYFTLPVMGYIFLKACFISFGQNNGVAQAIGLLLIEAAAVIATSVVRPWMDKTTNSFNITIAVVNFLNAICMLIFTSVFDQPPLMTGIVGIIFWILNAAVTLILLLMILITTTILFFQNNPDARYQFMADDRTSFMRSGTNLGTTNELDALAATARGEKGGHGSGLLEDDDTEATPSDKLRRSPTPVNGDRNSYRPSVDAVGNSQRNSLRHDSESMSSLPVSHRGQNNVSPAAYAAQNNGSVWQRGAGYDHRAV